MKLHYVFFAIFLISFCVAVTIHPIFIVISVAFFILGILLKCNVLEKYPYSFPIIILTLVFGVTLLQSAIQAYTDDANEFGYYLLLNLLSGVYLSFLLFGLEHYFPYRNDNEEKNKQLNIQLNEELIKQLNEQLNIQLNEELIKQINDQVKKQLNEQLTNQVSDEANIKKENIDE